MFTICLNHEQFFGKVFERKADNCCSILKSHHCNSKAQDKLASDYDFLLYELPKKKLNLTCESIGVSPVNILAVPPHSRTSNRKGKLKKVLNVYKENTSTNVLDIEIEEPSPIYDRDTKKDRLTDRLQGLN